MALVSYGKSFTLAAAADERVGILLMTSLSLAGTGMTAGQRLVITDTSGDPIADYYITATNENVELLVNKRWCKGVKLATAPAAGTYLITGQFE